MFFFLNVEKLRLVIIVFYGIGVLKLGYVMCIGVF